MAVSTVYSPELAQKLCQLVSAGVPLEEACKYERVSHQTVRKWLVAPLVGNEPYASFFVAWEQAQAAYLIGLQLRLTQAGKRGQWTADLAMAERRFGRYFGRPRRRDLEDEAALGESQSGGDRPLSDEELERIARGEQDE